MATTLAAIKVREEFQHHQLKNKDICTTGIIHDWINCKEFSHLHFNDFVHIVHISSYNIKDTFIANGDELELTENQFFTHGGKPYAIVRLVFEPTWAYARWALRERSLLL